MGSPMADGCALGKPVARAINPLFSFSLDTRAKFTERSMLSDIRIARQIMIAFGALIAAFVVTACCVVGSLSAADRATVSVRNNKAATEAAHALFASFVAEQNAVRGYVIGQGENMLRNVKSEREEYEQTLAAMHAAEADPAIQGVVTEVDRLVREWRVKSADRQIALAQDPATRVEATKFVNGSFAGKIRAGIDEIVAAEED